MEVSCEDEKLKSKIIALFVIEDDKRFSFFFTRCKKSFKVAAAPPLKRKKNKKMGI